MATISTLDKEVTPITKSGKPVKEGDESAGFKGRKQASSQDVKGRAAAEKSKRVAEKAISDTKEYLATAVEASKYAARIAKTIASCKSRDEAITFAQQVGEQNTVASRQARAILKIAEDNPTVAALKASAAKAESIINAALELNASAKAAQQVVENRTAVIVRKPLSPAAITKLEVSFAKNFTKIGFDIPDGTTFEEADGYMAIFAKIDQASNWGKGDLYNYIKVAYPENYPQILSNFPLSKEAEKTLRNAASLCKYFTPDRRRAGLLYTHHAEVKVLNDTELEDKVLDLAELNGWSTSETRKQVKALLQQAANASGESASRSDEEDREGGLVAQATITIDVSVNTLFAAATTYLNLEQVAELNNRLFAYLNNNNVESFIAQTHEEEDNIDDGFQPAPDESNAPEQVA